MTRHAGFGDASRDGAREIRRAVIDQIDRQREVVEILRSERHG